MSHRRRYMGLLRAFTRRPHAARSLEIMRRASRVRKRMIRRRRRKARNGARTGRRKNRTRSGRVFVTLMNMIKKRRSGRRALSLLRKFHGVKEPSQIEVVDYRRGPLKVLMGMGRSPSAYLTSRRSRRRPGRRVAHGVGSGVPMRVVRGPFMAVTNDSGTRIMLLRKNGKRKIGRRRKFVGYAAETHYIPSNGLEIMGSIKRGKHWVHAHNDEGGTFPKVYADEYGNYIYGPGTYRVGKWIRR